MDKNQFLMINHLVTDIHLWNSPDDIRDDFFFSLQRILPFQYASLFLHEDQSGHPLQLGSPICYPPSFIEAESHYLEQSEDDYLLWILRGRESALIRESAITTRQERLQSPLYVNCYNRYHIVDSLQYTIVAHQQLCGVLTLFRTNETGDFTSEDMFFLRAIGAHLNISLPRLLRPQQAAFRLEPRKESICAAYSLTGKEWELLMLLTDFPENRDLAETMHIRETTLQKHLQNLFRKCGVSSRWELMHKLFRAQQL